MKIAALLLCTILACFGLCALGDCPAAPPVPEDRRTNKSVLKVGTFNAEWLFLTTYNAASCPGAGCSWKDFDEAVKHLEEVAAEIVTIDADILVIQEVRECDVLQSLIVAIDAISGSASGYRPYLVKGTDTATGQNVGLITRVDPTSNLQRTESRAAYPVAGTKCAYTGAPDTYGVSKHFFTTFEVAGLDKTLMLVGAHFLAFPDRVDRCVQREAQASVLQTVIRDALRSGFHVIATGDLNDFDGTTIDRSNNKPISQVLDILRDSDSNIAGDELVNAATLITQTNRFSNWYSPSTVCSYLFSMIDHVLVDLELAKRVTHAEISHSYEAFCGGFESDHWPVVVTIDTSARSALNSVKDDQPAESSSMSVFLVLGIVFCGLAVMAMMGVKAIVGCVAYNTRSLGNAHYIAQQQHA